MNFLKLNLKYVIIIMVGATIFSCSKAEDGAIGPIGPAGAIGQTGAAGQDGADGLNGGQDGADGATGATGTAGADGAAGADGNANVISSGWYTLANSEWTANGNNKIITATKDDAEITQEVMDTAVILAYIDRGPGNSGVYSLPIVELFSYTYYINNVGGITYRHYKSDGGTVSAPTSIKFRHVIIPASTSGKSSIDFTKMTYEEVMDHFDLEY